MTDLEALVDTISKIAQRADSVVFLAIFIYGLYTGKIMWGKDHQQDMDRSQKDQEAIKEERDNLREIVNVYNSRVEQKLEELERRFYGPDNESS